MLFIVPKNCIRSEECASLEGLAERLQSFAECTRRVRLDVEIAMSQPPHRLSESTWPWPDSLHAFRAAPAHPELFLENEPVRVIPAHIPMDDLAPLHTQRRNSVAYVMSCSDFIRGDQGGNALFDSRQAAAPKCTPSVQWPEPLPPPTVENVGTQLTSILGMELKGS